MTQHEVVGTRVPIRIWTDPLSVEPQAMAQLRNIANLPWVHGLAVMPDVHLGKGATVGSVIAMRDAVCPAAVGVDIGCGMSAVRTSLTSRDLPDSLRPLRDRLEATVPVGFCGHAQPVDLKTLPIDPKTGKGPDSDWDGFWSDFGQLHPGVQGLRGRAGAQMGTLGGGNHFIEVCLDRAVRTRTGSGSCSTPAAATSARSWPSGTSPWRGTCRTTPTCPTATSRSSSPARRRWRPTGATCSGRRSTRGATGR